MSSMAGVPWAGYVRPACSTCKPGPDGSLTPLGLGLTIVGVGVLLIGIWALMSASRSDRGTRSAAGQPAPDPDAPDTQGIDMPVMDAVQREDLERRARRAAEQAAQPEKQTTPGKQTKSDVEVGRALVILGLGAAVFGLIFLGLSESQVSDDESQLREAASNLVSGAIDGPAGCRETAAVMSSYLPSSPGESQFLPSASNCDGSPRSYAQQNSTDTSGVYIPVEYVFSQSFTANGEVTVHDKQDNRSLCVTVPADDVAAEQGDAPIADAPPSFDDVSVDPSPYIKDGACPDAPVSEQYSLP